MRRPFNGALAAVAVTNLGGAVPIALLSNDHDFANANAWDFIASGLLGLSVIALVAFYLMNRYRPWVEWTLRLAGAVWVAYGFAIATLGRYDSEARISLALIWAGIGFTQLVMANRIERGTA